MLKLCSRNFSQLAFVMVKTPETSALQHFQLVASKDRPFCRQVVVRLHAISLPASKGGQSSLLTSDVFRDCIANKTTYDLSLEETWPTPSDVNPSSALTPSSYSYPNVSR